MVTQSKVCATGENARLTLKSAVRGSKLQKRRERLLLGNGVAKRTFPGTASISTETEITTAQSHTLVSQAAKFLGFVKHHTVRRHLFTVLHFHMALEGELRQKNIKRWGRPWGWQVPGCLCACISQQSARWPSQPPPNAHPEGQLDPWHGRPKWSLSVLTSFWFTLVIPCMEWASGWKNSFK